MTEQEEFLLRMGFDTTAMDRGTADMLSRQRAAAREYVGFWNKALAEQGAAEAKANDASLARLKANMEAKSAVTKEFFAAQAAQLDIAAGSIPAGMAAGTAAGAVSGGPAGRATREVGREAKGLGTAMRETAVMIREGFRHNWSRMVGSFSILASAISGWAFVIAGAVALIAGPSAMRAYTAYRGMVAGKEGEKEALDRARRHAESGIRLLDRYKKLKIGESEDWTNMLASGKESDIFKVLGMLGGRFGPGGRRQFEQLENLDDQIEKSQKALDAINSKKEKGVNVDQKVKNLQDEIRYGEASLKGYSDAELNNNAKLIQYKQDKLQLLQNELDLQDELTIQQKEQADAAKATKEWQDWSNRTARDWMRGTINTAMEEREIPSIAALAGRQWVERLNRGYGRGGIYDLERGNGPYGEISRDYLLAQKQQQYDASYGNNSAAEQDRQRMIADRNKLITSGVADPAVLIGKIGEDTARVRQLFDALVQSGLILKSN